MHEVLRRFDRETGWLATGLRYCQKLCIEAWRILVEMID